MADKFFTRAMKLFFDKRLLEYSESGYAETPERLEAIITFLVRKGIGPFYLFPPATEAEILAVHDIQLLHAVQNNTFFNPNCPNIQGIYSYALLSAGGALAAAKNALQGKNSMAFIRPPGHHASRRSVGGFCYFNNIAVASQHLLSLGKRVAILDLDGHHCNGTEDIFRGRKDLLLLSIHQSPVYPFTGFLNFENCKNYPLASGSGWKKYRVALKSALSDIHSFSPDIIAISLGFDTHEKDYLLHLSLKDSDYFSMAKMIAALKKPSFFLLEGGYNADTIGNACYSFLEGFKRSTSTCATAETSLNKP
ncbi:MAG: histone deacetylase [Candidatus Ratteibacteria bacterium]